MKDVSKKAKLLAGIFLGSTLLFGNVHAKVDNPTEIDITANKPEYTQLIREGKPLHVELDETLRLDIAVRDEDGLKSHRAYVLGLGEAYSKNTEDMEDGGKLSKEYIKFRWYTPEEIQLKIIVEDKNDNVTEKIIELYFSK